MHGNRRKRRRRIYAAGAAIATSLATLVGLVGFTGAPAFAGTNANTSYEFDCTTALSPGQVAPFIVTANLSAAPDPSFPTGATFGASGALSVTLSGGFIAGFAANGVLTPAGVGVNVHDLTLAPTDANSTGSYVYSHSFAQVPATTNTVSGVTWASGSTTLSGPFAADDVGKGVTGGTGLPQGATIVAVTAGTDATINAPTTAAQASGTDVTLYAPMTFTDAAVSTGNVFTTNGTTGGNANIGATSASGFDAVVALTVPFGSATGGEGVGPANCLETGWDASANPGPAQTGAATPQTPPGATTPLVLASGGFVAQPGTTQQITPPASSFVALDDPPPVAQDKTYLLNEGTSKTITLVATDDDATPVIGFSIVSGPTDPRLTVGTPAANGEVTITDTGSGPAVVTFEFTASDANGPGNVATATINITSTMPVDEPLTQNVIGGQLVLSCSNPDTNGGTPLLTCPEFQFPDITLNGVTQTSTGSGSTLYVSDNRGDPNVGWTLTASMIATPIGPGSNTNASCDGIVAFCNADVGTHALDVSGNGQIAPSNLSIGSIICAPHAGNLNLAATPGAGGTFATTQTICTAAATQSGGTFDVTKSYTLTVPSSVYAGNYWGTVEFLVQ